MGGMGGDDRLLTVNEVAESLRVSTMTVYRMLKSGQLPATRVGRSYRFRLSDVERYLEQGRVEPDPGP